MEKHGLEAALERINAGAPIPRIEPSQIEHVWERLSGIRRETQQNGIFGLKNSGSDVARPKIGEKFIDWIRSHC